MAVEDGRLTEIVITKFVVDECLSAPIARALAHCAKKRTPTFLIESLSKHEKGKCETQWMPNRIRRGYVTISSDTNMISDHDIAAFVRRHNGMLFLLRSEVSQQKRWELLKWLVVHLPMIELTARNSKPGTTWLASKNGSVIPVEPTP